MDGVRAGNRIVVVGAGPAGLAAVRAYREHGGHGNVTIVSREPRLPYERPPLTKDYLRGESDAGDLTIESESWFDEHGIDLLLDADVTGLDAKAATVRVGDALLSGDAVVLATGAAPLRPALPGLDDPRVRTIREQPDSELIARQVRPGIRVAVLGTGFIGCEVAASLAMKGAEVVLVGPEAAPQRERLGTDVSDRISTWLTELGVELRMGVQVSRVEDARRLVLEDGGILEAELVIAAMGVTPRCDLAKAAGLEILNGRIGTDERMRAAARVFAAGDVTYAFNRTAGRRLAVEHWGDALTQGEIVGQVLAGHDAVWDSVPGFWSTIGEHTIQYAAWGDGYDDARLEEQQDGAFAVWYQRHGVPVGVLAYKCEDEYERGRQLIHDEGPQSW